MSARMQHWLRQRLLQSLLQLQQRHLPTEHCLVGAWQHLPWWQVGGCQWHLVFAGTTDEDMRYSMSCSE
jgi:hypothetical protein